MEEKIYNLIKERGPWFLKGSLLSKLVYKSLSKYLKVDETIYAGDFIQDMSGPDAFNWLGENYTANCKVEGIENIPLSGKCLIVSNHPMGPADAIAIYHQIYKVRKDIFFFANEIFIYLVGSFENIFAPVFWDKEKQVHTASKTTYRNIKNFFLDNRIGILFPSGRLSKLTFSGLKDRKWEKFLLSLLTRESKICHCKIRGDGHAVLRYKGRYIDNIQKKWCTKKYMENRDYKFSSWLYIPYQVVIKLIIGFFQTRKRKKI